MGMGEVLQWTNLAFIPLLVYIIKLEVRMARIELMISAEYKAMMTRGEL